MSEHEAGRSPADRGRESRERGKEFEADLDALHSYYLDSKQAWLRRLPIATNPLPPELMRRFPSYRVIAKQRGQVDFYGGSAPAHGDSAGRLILIEAKRSMPLTALRIIPRPRKGEGNKKSHGFGLHEEQLDTLVAAWRISRAIAGVVWKNGEQCGALFGPGLERCLADFVIGSQRSIPWAYFIPVPDARLARHPRACPDWIRSLTPCRDVHAAAHTQRMPGESSSEPPSPPASRRGSAASPTGRSPAGGSSSTTGRSGASATSTRRRKDSSAAPRSAPGTRSTARRRARSSGDEDENL